MLSQPDTQNTMDDETDSQDSCCSSSSSPSTYDDESSNDEFESDNDDEFDDEPQHSRSFMSMLAVFGDSSLSLAVSFVLLVVVNTPM